MPVSRVVIYEDPFTGELKKGVEEVYTIEEIGIISTMIRQGEEGLFTKV